VYENRNTIPKNTSLFDKSYAPLLMLAT